MLSLFFVQGCTSLVLLPTKASISTIHGGHPRTHREGVAKSAMIAVGCAMRTREFYFNVNHTS